MRTDWSRSGRKRKADDKGGPAGGVFDGAEGAAEALDGAFNGGQAESGRGFAGGGLGGSGGGGVDAADRIDSAQAGAGVGDFEDEGVWGVGGGGLFPEGEEDVAGGRGKFEGVREEIIDDAAKEGARGWDRRNGSGRGEVDGDFFGAGGAGVAGDAFANDLGPVDGVGCVG